MAESENIAAYKRAETLIISKGISPYAVGKEIGLNSSFFSEWKKGKMMPSVANLLKLAAYLGVPMEYFLTDPEPEEERA